MSKVEVKAEGKRLRKAISDMFGVPVTMSQAYELLAKSKNYPCWDAYVANIPFTASRDVSAEELSGLITKMTRGLVLFTGTVGSGKTSLIRKVIQENSTSHLVDLSHQLSNSDVLNNLLRMDADQIYVGTIQSPAEAKQAIRIASNGTLVIAEMHASSTQVAHHEIRRHLRSHLEDLDALEAFLPRKELLVVHVGQSNDKVISIC